MHLDSNQTVVVSALLEYYQNVMLRCFSLRGNFWYTAEHTMYFS